MFLAGEECTFEMHAAQSTHLPVASEHTVHVRVTPAGMHNNFLEALASGAQTAADIIDTIFSLFRRRANVISQAVGSGNNAQVNASVSALEKQLQALKAAVDRGELKPKLAVQEALQDVRLATQNILVAAKAATIGDSIKDLAGEWHIRDRKLLYCSTYS